MDIGHEIIKFLEENTDNKLLGIGLGNDSFGFDTKSKGNKSRNKQAGLYKTKKFLHGKENHQQVKKQPTEREKIFGNHVSDWG